MGIARPVVTALTAPIYFRVLASVILSDSASNVDPSPREGISRKIDEIRYKLLSSKFATNGTPSACYKRDARKMWSYETAGFERYSSAREDFHARSRCESSDRKCKRSRR